VLSEDELRLLKSCKSRWLGLCPCLHRIKKVYTVLATYLSGNKHDLSKNIESPELIYILEFASLYMRKLYDMNQKFQSQEFGLTEIYHETTKTLKYFTNPILSETIVNPSDALYLYLDLKNKTCVKNSDEIFASVTKELNFSKYDGFEIKKVLNEFKKGIVSYLKSVILGFQQLIKCDEQNTLQGRCTYTRSQLILEASYFSPSYSILDKCANIEQIAQRFQQYHHEEPDELQYEFKTYLASENTGISCRDKYPKLWKLILTLKAIEVCNTPIERVFSFLGFFKNSRRNNMGLELLNALLIIRTYSKSAIFIPPLDLINSMHK